MATRRVVSLHRMDKQLAWRPLQRCLLHQRSWTRVHTAQLSWNYCRQFALKTLHQLPVRGFNPPPAPHSPLSPPLRSLTVGSLCLDLYRVHDVPHLIPDAASLLWKEWQYYYVHSYGVHSAKEVEQFIHQEVDRDALIDVLLVGVVDGKFASMVSLVSQDTPEGSEYHGVTPWATTLGAAEEFKGKGLAKATMQLLYDQAREWGYKFIWGISRSETLDFYKRTGWKEIEKLPIFDLEHTVLRYDLRVTTRECNKPEPQRAS
jgi:GNAT superfamily N-acetyltransferase